MRKFYLTNANNEQIDLNIIKHFFHNPTGLGMDKEIVYRQVGNSFLPLSDEYKQTIIEGDVFFETYEEYRKFVRFAEIKPLTMTYITDKLYYIDVNLKTIGKTEKGVGGLYCHITLTASSAFYQKIVMKNAGKTSRGKTYDYEYDFQYTNAQASTLSFEVDSNMECPTKITIIGPAVNPSWTYRLNGNVVATGRIRKDIPEGRRLVVDTTTIPYSIIEMDNNGDNVEDVYQYSDFSTQRFLMLRKGANVIRIAHEGGNDINLIVERRELYATV